MHKKTDEKIRDFFILMGKKHRILLPVAVMGLAMTMLITSFADYLSGSGKRFACLLFILCMFMIGNSFSYPIFSFDYGFQNENEKESIIADDSELTLTDKMDAGYVELPEEISVMEYGEMWEDDTYTLEDILDTVEVSDNESSEDNDYDEQITFRSDDWRLILINKQHPIPENYEFSLGKLSKNMQCDERIIDDLLLMMKDASKDNISLVICSPYRDLNKQEKLFLKKINNYMKKGYSYLEAYKLSSQAVTVPGASEHQIGLAIDIITNGYTLLDEGFADTDAGKWLENNCYKYGFVVRYPRNKEFITSIEYEPWHFRYVGREAAAVMMTEGLCLEEFWDKYL